MCAHTHMHIEFLKAEKVPATEFAMIEDAPDVTPLIREMALADRDVMEKGTVAFVSYVRGYKEHDLKYIFQAKHLDLNALAMCFGLLKVRIPSCFSTQALTCFEDAEYAGAA